MRMCSANSERYKILFVASGSGLSGNPNTLNISPEYTELALIDEKATNPGLDWTPLYLLKASEYPPSSLILLLEP